MGIIFCASVLKCGSLLPLSEGRFAPAAGRWGARLSWWPRCQSARGLAHSKTLARYPGHS
jgi:hypothetical protein